MSAEKLLLLWDECDDLNVVLNESVGVTALAAVFLLGVALVTSWLTASVALGLCTLVAGAWLGLALGWIFDRLRPVRAHLRSPVRTP